MVIQLSDSDLHDLRQTSVALTHPEKHGAVTRTSCTLQLWSTQAKCTAISCGQIAADQFADHHVFPLA